MNRFTTDYSKIDSFDKLSEVKLQKYYHTNLSKRKLELSVFQLQQSLSPSNIATSLLSYVAKPIRKSVLSWVGDKLLRTKKK